MHKINIINVEYVEAYRLNLEFNNGEWRTIDLEPELWGEAFEPLKDLDFFRQVRLEFKTLVWPNDTDLAPEYLYEKSQPLNRAAA
jgi:hypothetical protein